MITKKRVKIISVLAGLSLVFTLIFSIGGKVFGYVGPQGSPTSSSGYGQMDASGQYLSIGGQATSYRLYIYAPNSNSNEYGLRILEASSTPILRVRNDSAVIVGNPTISNLSTYKLQAEDIRATNYRGSHYASGTSACGNTTGTQCDSFTAGVVTVLEDPSDPGGSHICGLEASCEFFFGTITGFRNLGSVTTTLVFNNTIAASSVTPGVFGCRGSQPCNYAQNYNFEILSLLGVNTSSIVFNTPTSALMVHGTGYFSSSSLSVRTATPSNGPGAINLGLGGSDWTSGWKKSLRLDSTYPYSGISNEALELGGGTGENLYGIGVKHDSTSDNYQIAFIKVDPGYEDADQFSYNKGQNVIGFSSSTIGINNGNLLSGAPLVGSLRVSLFWGLDTIVVGKSSSKSSVVARNDNLFLDSTGLTSTRKIYLSNISQSGDIIIAHAGGKVGVSTSSLTTKLNVAGGIKGTGFFLSTSTSVGKVLVSDSSGNASWGTLGAGGGTQNYVPKWTASNTLTNSLIFESSGNVGINTSNPQYNLDVNGTMRSDGDSYLAYDGQGDINLGDSISDSIYPNAESYSNVTFNNSASTYTISGSNPTSGNGADLIIRTGDPRVSQNTSNLTIRSGSGSGAAAGNIELETFRNTTGNGFIAFITTSTYKTYPATGTERMRIINDGKIGIGTSTPAYKLHVYIPTTGIVAGFQNSNGTCTINPTAGSANCTSDLRLKKNISGVDNALSMISSIRGVTFEWKNQTDSARHYGFIAQELEKVVPEAVSTDVDGYKSVSKDTLVPLLAEAIKEQQSELKLIQSDFDFISQSISKRRN
ncbi:MAG: hypothetical protein G01um101420_586 [Parcubacteria group bacterium Gr01-1014_20]|nr:MAG: hypothetical protein G01um101420_586 [Parcubacteria group bacterium Gr01-1014_20]